MQKDVDPNYRVEGNKEVTEFLHRWLARADLGKLNFIGLIACQSATETFTDHVGVIGTEFAANFAVDNLKMQIMSNVFRRMAPPNTRDAPVNSVVYNMASAPCSFDFLAWLMTAEMKRVKAGAPGPLRVAFSFGNDQDAERSLVTAQRRTMYENVMKPLIPMMGAVEVPFRDLGPAQWPEVYTLKDAADMGREGIASPRITPSQQAVEKVEQYLNGRKPVVIVLREAEHWEHRNSNKPEWFKFVDKTLAQEDVIFLRDTAYAAEPLGPYHTMPPCSIEINSRVALYQRAKCVIGVGNGPMTLLFHTDTPWLMFAPIDPSGVYPPGRPEWWKPHHGIAPGEQFPWSGPHQKIIWELDNFENLDRAWKDLSKRLGEQKQLENKVVRLLPPPAKKVAKAKVPAKKPAKQVRRAKRRARAKAA